MRFESDDQTVDVAIVGAGAAGLAAAVFLTRRRPDWSVLLLDASKSPGTKLLLTGGERCNVTNRCVTPADYSGSNRNLIKRALAALSVDQTISLFREIGMPLHEEDEGKLFPDSNSARGVRDALVGATAACRTCILTASRVTAIQRAGEFFTLACSNRTYGARKVLLATGGLSYPKTGCDGSGYRLAEHLGHTLVPTTPALVPLLLEGAFHRDLAGITQEVELSLTTKGSKPVRTRGSLLWTHFGISGPAVLDISGHWCQAKIARKSPTVAASFLPGEDFASADQVLLDRSSAQPKLSLRNALSTWLPGRLCDAVLRKLGIPGPTPLAHVSRDHRRRMVHALLAWPLPVKDTRGYDHAEITAGGVPLGEVNVATMESRRCPGLFLAGEILDVTGRLGGFNLQWAWSSACAAARGMTAENSVSTSR
jgi:predicted Rossmann fold flavoprotein